jgi:uncharacterized membrane protein YgcG
VAGIGQFGAWRHAVVGVSILAGAGLTAAGIIGVPPQPERFDAKQVVVAPAGPNSLRIREVVDVDFGDNDRHGYQRVVDDDFGVPQDITAESPDADATVHVAQTSDSEGRPQTQIRLGSPSETVSGQHRYILSYTLPNARLDTGQLTVDVVPDGDTMEIDRFEAVVTGIGLAAPSCSVGSRLATGGCTLALAGDTYRATISPVAAGDGVTIGGGITGIGTPVDVALPSLPPRRDEQSRVPLAVAMIPIGLAGAGAVYLLARRRGRNEVFAGGAADAAFGPRSGSLPPPGGGPLPPPGSVATAVRPVPDSQMGELATTEFAPPNGIAPWQGDVLLREKIDQSTVSAWFSGHAARDVITISKDDDGAVVLGKGPRFADAEPTDAAILATLFRGDDRVVLDGYDKDFATAWAAARGEMQRSIAASGFWKRLPPSASGSGCGGAISMPALIFLGVWLFIGAGSILSAVLGVFHGPVGGIIFGLAVPAVTAFAMYHSLLPARSATGSALALRTESFRRFLAASEGRHVEWAWKQGVLREYSAWAVALGTAETWQRAMAATSIPPAELNTGPLLLWSMAPAFHSGYTASSSSGGGGGGSWGGGGGGGFSGSVGGGGGGGSSGSW